MLRGMKAGDEMNFARSTACGDRFQTSFQSDPPRFEMMAGEISDSIQSAGFSCGSILAAPFDWK